MRVDLPLPSPNEMLGNFGRTNSISWFSKNDKLS